MFSSDKVQAVTDFGAGLLIIWRANDSLDGLAEDDVGSLIA